MKSAFLSVMTYFIRILMCCDGCLKNNPLYTCDSCQAHKEFIRKYLLRVSVLTVFKTSGFCAVKYMEEKFLFLHIRQFLFILKVLMYVILLLHFFFFWPYQVACGILGP